jgi:two-component system chemotaxis sensor kinase CheA
LSIDNRQELIETIDEIFPRLEELKAGPIGIKPTSDVMLALEKITPDVQKNLPDYISEIPISFSRLFEKFLMESAENAETGIKLCAEGLAVVRRAVEGGNPAGERDAAENVLLKLSAEFKITSPAIADMVVTAEEAGKTSEPAEPEARILSSSADEVLVLLGLATSTTAGGKPQDGQTEAEAIFAQALAEGEEAPSGWKEPAAPGPVAGPGEKSDGFGDIMAILEGEGPEEPAEPESAPEEEGESPEKILSDIKSVLESKSEFPTAESMQSGAEEILEETAEKAHAPHIQAVPEPARQEETEAIFKRALAHEPRIHLDPDGRRQMEAEAAMERVREETAEPVHIDMSSEIERQKETEDVFRAAKEAAKSPPGPSAEPAPAVQAEVEAIFKEAAAGEAKQAGEPSVTVGQAGVEEILAQFGAQEAMKAQEPVPAGPEQIAPPEPKPLSTPVFAPTPMEEPAGLMEETEEDEDPFAQMGAAEPYSPATAYVDPPTDPLSEKLSAVASEVTLMESDMSDKKGVSSVMLAFEAIHSQMVERKLPAQVTVVADALSALYEKILMEGLSDNRQAVDLTINGVMILSTYLENPAAEGVSGQGRALLFDLKEAFGVEPQRGPNPWAAPAAPAIPADAVAGDLKKGPKFLGYESVQLATSEDMLIYSEFVSEVGDAVSHIETDLLELEEAPEDMDLVNDLFRGFHSMKGAAGFLGVNTVNILCHEAETLLDRFRKRTMVSDQASVDLLLKTLDVVKLVNEGLSEGCEKAKMNMPGAFLEIPRYEINYLSTALAEAAARKVEMAPPAAVMAVAVAAVAEEEEEAEEKEADKSAKLGQILVDEGKITEEDVELALRAQKEKRPLGEILVEMGVVDEPSVEQALLDQMDRKKKTKAATLKIDTEKLDSLLEMVGELVISQSIVNQEAASLVGERARLAKNIQSLGKITKNIQDQVMTLRMVPLKQTFQKMSRLVRDLSKKMKKPVAFHVSGEDTEIDKTIIEELNDPLVHLLRNAMDHGVEPPEERSAKNKPKTGSIWLNAYHRGGNVYIEVIDDGRGLDMEKIRRKAVEKGLLAEDAELSDQEAHTLVLLPGFSTHDHATDISGRGVGMDVVRSNIDALGGRLDISSRAGEGSEFTVRLPLTMAIVDGMIVRIGQDRFVIPTISIRESIRPKREEISTFKNKGEMIEVRGKLLPLVRLRRFLGIGENGGVNPWEGLVIIVESDEREFGFMVDDLLGQQQVVIKSLDRRFKGLRGISGGTILGDGKVGLILDVGSVVEYN